MRTMCYLLVIKVESKVHQWEYSLIYHQQTLPYQLMMAIGKFLHKLSHWLFTGNKGRKQGSPVRIFTNLSPADITLPTDDGNW